MILGYIDKQRKLAVILHQKEESMEKKKKMDDTGYKSKIWNNF